jgi:hypothetical protein
LDKHNQQFFLRETEQERGGFAAMPRLSKSPPESIRFAGLLPDSEVIQRVKIAESPVKRAFRGVCLVLYCSPLDKAAIFGVERLPRIGV